jgi:hypothetical protein
MGLWWLVCSASVIFAVFALADLEVSQRVLWISVILILSNMPQVFLHGQYLDENWNTVLTFDMLNHAIQIQQGRKQFQFTFDQVRSVASFLM